LSSKTTGKVGLIVLFVAIAVGSVFGLLYGILGLAFSGDYGWIALIVGSVVAFIGAIFGLVMVARGLRVPSAKKEKRPLRNIIIWIVVAIVSGSGAFLSYFFGRRSHHLSWIVYIIALLAALFLFSFFVLIFGGKRKIAEVTETTSLVDVEININDEQNKMN